MNIEKSVVIKGELKGREVAGKEERRHYRRRFDARGVGAGLSPARLKTLVGRILPISPPIADALDRRRARRDPTSPLVFHRDGIPRAGYLPRPPAQ